MKLAIVDYKSGNISSVINSFKEVAQNKVKIEVTSDVNKIKSSDKVVLPGQGSFKSCIDALNSINGLTDTLSEIVRINKFIKSINEYNNKIEKYNEEEYILNDFNYNKIFNLEE